MSTLSISDRLADPNSLDTLHTVDTRLTGGAIVLDVGHVAWLGRDLIKVDIPGIDVALYVHEARELAAALQSLATYIEEEGA
ncbi:MAG: hypothetical protein ACTHZ9_03325 [Leucobacter sp.]